MRPPRHLQVFSLGRYIMKTTMKINCLLLAFALIAIASISAPAQNPALPKGVERVTSVEGITEYRLAHGLRVLLFPDPSKQTMTVNMTYLVGSAVDDYGETAMAHCLYDMSFKRSPNTT